MWEYKFSLRPWFYPLSNGISGTPEGNEQSLGSNLNHLRIAPLADNSHFQSPRRLAPERNHVRFRLKRSCKANFRTHQGLTPALTFHNASTRCLQRKDNLLIHGEITGSHDILFPQLVGHAQFVLAVANHWLCKIADIKARREKTL
jgi:hypothetical protein